MSINKYRLWCTQTKEFIDQCNFCIDGHGDIFIIGSSGRLCRADSGRFLLSMFTGLCDKCGVEIYEGDIVKYYGQKFYQNYGYHPLIKITWQEKTAKFVWEGRDRLFGFNPGTTRLMEVVGNIYETSINIFWRQQSEY